MRALVYRSSKNFVIEERPLPRPGVGELLVKPLYVGLCFSDKHLYDGLYNVDEIPGASTGLGMIGGHEFSAEIVGTGEGVSGWNIGEEVSIDPRVYCGQCLSCRAGLATLCTQGVQMLGVTGLDGGLAELCVVPSYSAYRLPPNLDPLRAACAEPACCGTRAVRNSGITIGDNVVVLGLEDYNMSALHWLLRGGARQVIAADPLCVRRTAAKEIGAQFVMDPASQDLEKFVRQTMPFGADAILVACEDYLPEADQYLPSAFSMARPQGTVVITRAYKNPYLHINQVVPWLKELTIRYAGNFFGNEPWRGGRDRGDWQITLESMASAPVPLPPSASKIIPFSTLKSKADVDAVYESIPTMYPKVFFNMTA